MIVDYERAWVRLQAEVASKSQHGRGGLLRSMAEIAEECQVPAGELSRLLRLYGVEVERVRAAEAEIDRDSIESFGGGSVSPADAERPGHHDHIGGHDGRIRNGSAGAAAYAGGA